ncbi:hypothetical protein QTP81_11020 [Alteromonas sp. ASW11-36]|uniref:Peptidase C39-like domain-containing protein n=1 Tax=Alteromonas arenosi TaxID=3055817 RepID=A0ABT7SY56_9ALTE|nr:hypothetical protein [Alteromonas sp. ASW11-36]MDM7861129.1 hypothetical protein [Alteromonas sp. ASW11-36]
MRHNFLCLLTTLMLTGCLHLPVQQMIETPQDSATMIELPATDSDVWIAAQGIPLRVNWLAEGHSEYAFGNMFVLPYVIDQLPYLNTEESQAWIEHINNTYQPEPAWVYNPDNRMGHYKCMSISAATIINWHALNVGQSLQPFTSWLSGKQESGIDHRALDALYYQRAQQEAFADTYELLDFELDPVEQTPISYRMPAFAEIISLASQQPQTTLVIDDYVLPGVSHTLDTTKMPMLTTVQVFDYQASYEVRDDGKEHTLRLKHALHQYGPIYAGIRIRFASSGGVITDSAIGRFSIPNMSGHAVVIVGYVEQGDDTYFIYRETFGRNDTTSSQGGPAYRVYPAHVFNEAYAFQSQAG